MSIKIKFPIKLSYISRDFRLLKKPHTLWAAAEVLKDRKLMMNGEYFSFFTRRKFAQLRFYARSKKM